MSLHPSQNLTFCGITFLLNITLIIQQKRFSCHWLVRGMNAAPQSELLCYCKLISYTSFGPLWSNYIKPLKQYLKPFKYSLQPSSKSNSTKVIFINIIVNYTKDCPNYLLEAGIEKCLATAICKPLNDLAQSHLKEQINFRFTCPSIDQQVKH